jgi:uncharacterized membrane protein YfcA|tara:strand:+ start:397 stop:1191 length:795 start_codon:yes stop_codon:yes gene_type:complete
MTVYLLYAICGSVGGFLGGFLGLGGGIIFVPTLFFIFTLYGFNSEHIMQSAVSTSLACVIISSLSAALKHNKNKLINWIAFKKMLPGLILGSVLGVILITVLSNEMIKFYYGILLILISLYLTFEQENQLDKTISNEKHKFIHIFSFFTGSISTMLGIGGGTLTTPYFKYHGDSMKTSIATAAACGVPIALFGIVITFLINGIFGIFSKTIFDFIILDAFIIMSVSTLIFSYIGAGVTFISNTILLKYIFSVILLITGFTILIF